MSRFVQFMKDCPRQKWLGRGFGGRVVNSLSRCPRQNGVLAISVKNVKMNSTLQRTRGASRAVFRTVLKWTKG